MSIFITLLLNLLVAFITKLIEQWLANHLGDTPAAFPTGASLALYKNDFLDKVDWRFWFGPKRMTNASKAFDLAVQKYSNLPKLYLEGDTALKPAEVAQLAVSGIAEAL
jgi:hypothetical protein